MKLIVCCGTHEALFYVSLNASQISRLSFCSHPHGELLTHSPELTGSINLFTDKKRYRISVLPDGRVCAGIFFNCLYH